MGVHSKQRGQSPIHRRVWLQSVAGLFLAGAAGGIYSTHIEPDWIDVEDVSVSLPGLDPVFEGYRIVQVSDIHADGDWMHQQRLADIVSRIHTFEPDLVAITGDFVLEPLHPLVDVILGELGSLRARDAVVAVLGNHDHWSDPDHVRAILQEQGVVELRDDVMTIRRDQASLHIAGLDSLWTDREYLSPLSAHQERLDTLAARIPTGEVAVLLVHEPDIADQVAQTGRFGLQLSGHSHGGQVRMPVSGAILLPPLGQKYSAGLSRVGLMLQYTNRGVGMIPPQVRFNCRPEITVVTLHRA